MYPIANKKERARVLLELGVLGVFAAVFLVAFPGRPRFIDAVLAAAAVALILLGSRRSRALWAAAGAPVGDRRAAWRDALLFTLPVALLFFVVAWFAGNRSGGTAEAIDRVAAPNLPLAMLLYFPWAVLQQFVFQFFLLGRLLYVLPVPMAVAVVAASFGAVHYPRWPVMAVTLIAGAVWALMYRRHRRLMPLAVSHAVLGASLHYWVFGRDLLAGWLNVFR